ncbi:MAG TPA: hypothetical protein VHW70_01575 [Edaphobacter sp.]|jgi:hypothetical protein|nr:hypothetical protein [Edaphobacter sp.]
MIYKFVISKTYEGLLRVRVTTANHFELALVIYDDDKAFLRLVRHAGLTAQNERLLERAVVVAFSPIRAESFCDDIDLSEEQLAVLRLSMARQIRA